MYVEVIFLVLLGNIYSEDRVLRNSVDKCKYPSLIQQTEAEVDFLSKRLTALRTKLSSCKVEPVTSSFTAFTATLSSKIITFSPGEIIKYSRVLANIGECYDSSTGVFTVKTPGIYSVSASLMSGVDKTAHLTLMKNGKILVWLYTGVSYDMASQTINVALSEGEKIWVKLERGSELHADYNVFTAVLIKTGQF